jgi:hypothetical protein
MNVAPPTGSGWVVVVVVVPGVVVVVVAMVVEVLDVEELDEDDDEEVDELEVVVVFGATMPSMVSSITVCEKRLVTNRLVLASS